MSERSNQWALLRGKAPKVMPWSNHSEAGPADRDYFDRLRAQKGTSAALRLWKDFLALMDCLQAMPEDSIQGQALTEDQEIDLAIAATEAQNGLKEFAKRLEFRSPDEAREFWAVFSLWRTTAGGAARHSFAKAARLRSAL